MSRILLEGSSEFSFFLFEEASASQLPRVLFLKIFGFNFFIDQIFFEFYLFGSVVYFKAIFFWYFVKQLRSFLLSKAQVGLRT